MGIPNGPTRPRVCSGTRARFVPPDAAGVICHQPGLAVGAVDSTGLGGDLGALGIVGTLVTTAISVRNGRALSLWITGPKDARRREFRPVSKSLNDSQAGLQLPRRREGPRMIPFRLPQRRAESDGASRVMRLAARLVVLLLATALCSMTVTGSAWAATNWLVHVATTNTVGWVPWHTPSPTRSTNRRRRPPALHACRERDHDDVVEQREVFGQSRKHHAQLEPVLCAALRPELTGPTQLRGPVQPGGWSSGQAPGGLLKSGSVTQVPCDQSPTAGSRWKTDVMSASSASP